MCECPRTGEGTPPSDTFNIVPNNENIGVGLLASEFVYYQEDDTDVPMG